MGVVCVSKPRSRCALLMATSGGPAITSTAVLLLLFAVVLLHVPVGVDGTSGCQCSCGDPLSPVHTGWGCLPTSTMDKYHCTCNTGCKLGGCGSGYVRVAQKWCTWNMDETCQRDCERLGCNACKVSYYGERCAKRCTCNGGKCISTMKDTESKCVCFGNHGFSGPQCTGGVFTYQGCYLAKVISESNSRILSTSAKGSPTVPMTVPYCYHLAAKQYQATAFGLQNGNECWVGNVTASHIRDNFKEARFGSCGQPCAGDAQLSCGGPRGLAMDVYTVNS